VRLNGRNMGSGRSRLARRRCRPWPPAGSPDRAPPEVLALIESRMAPFRQRRAEAVVRAAARLNEPAGG